MSKTKNAFAFRDFDSARILQRPFFKDFYFASDKSDAEILESLNKATEDSADSWERRLYSIKAILERLAEFRHLIDRHNEKRLNKYNREKSEVYWSREIVTKETKNSVSEKVSNSC